MTIVCLNGRYLEEKQASLSVRDAGFLYGEAIYETLRTRQGRLMNLELHLNRLAEAAEAVAIPLPARKTLATQLQRTVDRNDFWGRSGQESRVRLTVSGGVHGFDAPSQKPTVLIVVEPLAEVSKSARLRGVSVVTFPIERPIPHIKTAHLIPSLMARRFMRKKRAYEVLLVDRKGLVTEGSISNVFMVKGTGRRATLITPRSSVLGGTTRARILTLASVQGWRVKERDISLKQLLKADEVFICNAPRGVVPVVKVDGQRIGEGRVGPLTRSIWQTLKAV